MGKNFPSLKTLKTHPEYWKQTTALIEKAFKYKTPWRFEDDFITLMNPLNAHHLYILSENDKVIAHLGVKVRDLNINDHKIPLAMMGGIAVDEAYRGKGLFSYMMSEVKKIHHDNIGAFILWSDLPSMYEKHGFYLCGSQYPFARRSEKTRYQLLDNASSEEQQKIKAIYQHFFQKHFAYIERTQSDWDQLFQSKISHIWVNDRSNITSYFVQNKGMDLHNIIHEYATVENRTDFLKQISHWGEVWMTQDYFHEDNAHFQFLLAAGGKFNKLISLLSSEQINLTSIANQECYFKFKDNEYVMNSAEFFSGVFGPARFSELKNSKDVFITGWDSI